MPSHPNRVRNTVLVLLLIGFLLAVLLLLLPSGPVPPTEPEEVAGTEEIVGNGEVEERPETSVPALLAVVIDDVGYSMAHLEPFLRFPGAMTIAVLPHLPYSGESAWQAEESGKEVILHCPMEPLGGEDPGPGAIMADQQDGEIKRRLEEAFRSVSVAQGMNNHMGSKIMQSDRVMRVVMTYLKERDGFFLDSKTIAGSVAVDVAREYEVPHLSRSIFLDNDGSKDAIREQFLSGIEVAEQQGYAVLIGHVQNAAILDVWQELIPQMENRGVETISLSELMGS